jgi:hypothetical protein
MVGERISGFVAWGQWRGWYVANCGTMGMPPCPPNSTTAGASERAAGPATAPADVTPPPPPPPPPPPAASSNSAGNDQGLVLGGEMGNGIMMNTQLSYLNNKILEGNKIVRWSAMGGGSYLPGFQKFYNGATFNIEGVTIKASTGDCHKEPGGICHDWSQLVATSAVIYRGNTALSNGGFNINSGVFTAAIRDVIIEGNSILKSDSYRAFQVDARMLNVTSGSVVARGNILPS